jgi:hypothetical protein
MKDAPSFDMNQFYHFLDGVVDEYGVYLFMGFIFLSPFLIAWLLRWARKHPDANRPVGTFPHGHPPPRDPYKDPMEFNEANYKTWL